MKYIIVDVCNKTKMLFIYIFIVFTVLILENVLFLSNIITKKIISINDYTISSIILFTLLMFIYFDITFKKFPQCNKNEQSSHILKYLAFPVFSIEKTGVSTFKFLNNTFRDMHGYAEAKNLSDWDVVSLSLHPEQRDSFTAQFEAVLNSERTELEEFRFIDIYGKAYYYKILLKIMDDTFPQKFTGTFIDTTEKWEIDKKFLETKLELEKRIIDRTTDLIMINDEILTQNIFIKNIIEAISFPFFVVDANTYRIRLANQASGISNQSSYQKCYETLYNKNIPCFNDQRKCPVEILKSTKKQIIYEFEDVLPDGSVKNIEIFGYPLFDIHGEVKDCVIYLQDITERKKNENLLEESEEKFRNIFKSSPIGIALFDSKGNVLEANPIAIKYLSISMQVPEIETEMKEFKIPANYMPLLQDGIAHRFEIVIPLNGNSLESLKNSHAKDEKNSMFFDVSINPIVLREKQANRGYLVHFKDITEEKRIEKALRISHFEAEQANRLKSEFLANVSHDLRTPLNAIINFSNAMQKGIVGEMNAEQSHLSSRIYASGQRLLQLINDLLDISKIESGNMDLDVSKFFLPDFEKIIDDAAIPYKKPDVELVVNIQEIFFFSDKQKIEQIIYNLVSNSFKYTDIGTVTVDIRVENEMMTICVQDTGIGIKAKDIDKIFDKYIQSTRISSIKSTGLGLAIVKELCAILGGSVSVKSTVGKGSIFTAAVANMKDVNSGYTLENK